MCAENLFVFCGLRRCYQAARQKDTRGAVGGGEEADEVVHDHGLQPCPSAHAQAQLIDPFR